MPLVHFGLEDKVLESSDVNTAQKLKFSIKDFFSKCDQTCADFVTFTEEILNGKLDFLCSVKMLSHQEFALL